MAARRGIGKFGVMRTPEDVPTDPDALIRYGRVTSVDPVAGFCVVELDDGVEPPPLRWAAGRMGETVVWLPPSVGEQVKVDCPGGEIAAGLVSGSVPSDANPPPATGPVPLIKFKDGAVFSYDPETHALSIQLPSGGTTVLTSDGGIDLVGPVSVTGKVTASEDVLAGSVSLKNHKHSGVAAGSAQSGAPV